jgi:hypothetical protein
MPITDDELRRLFVRRVSGTTGHPCGDDKSTRGAKLPMPL